MLKALDNSLSKHSLRRRRRKLRSSGDSNTDDHNGEDLDSSPCSDNEDDVDLNPPEEFAAPVAAPVIAVQPQVSTKLLPKVEPLMGAVSNGYYQSKFGAAVRL